MRVFGDFVGSWVDDQGVYEGAVREVGLRREYFVAAHQFPRDKQDIESYRELFSAADQPLWASFPITGMGKEIRYTVLRFK